MSTSPAATRASEVVLTTLAGSGPGFADGRSQDARFREPNGIEADASGNIFIADTGNHRIRKIAPDGSVVTIAGGERGFQDGLASAARFDSPYGLALRRDGTIFVADSQNHRIRAISPEGEVRTVAGAGVAGAEDGGAEDARLNLPFSLALDALDNLIVADTGNHRIRRIDNAGTVTTLAGGGAGYRDGASGEALFNAPSDVGLDARGRIYVADMRNHAIRELDPVGHRVRTVAGNGEAALADGDADSARLNLPTGLAVTLGGSIFVADSQNRAVRLVTMEGRVTTVFRSGLLGLGQLGTTPVDIALGAQGAIMVTDAARGLVLISK